MAPAIEDIGQTIHHLSTQAIGNINALIELVEALLSRRNGATEGSTMKEATSNLHQLVQMSGKLSEHIRRMTEGYPSMKPPSALDPSIGNFCRQSKELSRESEQPSLWSGFYTKTVRERMDVLHLVYPKLNHLIKSKETQIVKAKESIWNIGYLSIRTADLMIENCVGVLGLPLGLGLNFLIDGESYIVPMAIEEPSVVAAASSAAKIIGSAGGGFFTSTSGNIMTAQIQLIGTRDIPQAIAKIDENRQRLLRFANEKFCSSMYKRGGGAIDVYCRVVTQADCASRSNWYNPANDELEIYASSPDVRFLVVHIDIDVCEAMGANVVNSVAEGLSDEVCAIAQSTCGLRILTNFCTQRRARAAFEIPVAKLGWKGVYGSDVAHRVIEAYNFAAVDPFRAVTNNKGIMNGIDAVAIATGQDWRAIEAGAHCYACRSGQYKSLSKYELVTRSDGVDVLRGSLELPMAVGSKGGALQTHPGYSITCAILGNPSARSLSGIIAAVGLAQNFAAVRAIAVTGIQHGHMALHARNFAVAAGAPSQLVTEVCAYMLGRKSINLDTAKDYLQAHALYSSFWNSPPQSPVKVIPPSMFYVEVPVPGLDRHISLNVAFESLGTHPEYIAIKPTSRNKQAVCLALQHQLLGDKGYKQLERMFSFVASMRSVLTPKQPFNTQVVRVNLEFQNTLQLVSILINIVSYRLVEVAPHTVPAFIAKLLQSSAAEVGTITFRAIVQGFSLSNEVLRAGLPLLFALWQVLHYRVEQEVVSALLRNEILQEQRHILRALVASFHTINQDELGSSTNSYTLDEAFKQFMRVHSKRWQATMLLLIDSLTLEPELRPQDALPYLHDIGELLEWKGTVAHDIARYKRAIPEHEPNAFIYWLKKKNINPEMGDGFIGNFQAFLSPFLADKLDHLQQQISSTHMVDLAAVKCLLVRIQNIYQKL